MSIDRERIRAAVERRLSARSFEHSMRVAEQAERLAETYGVDADAAWAAGALHDWDRDLTAEELVSAARAVGIEVTPFDLRVPHLLHARTAAAEVAATFPSLGAEIIDAIERHTVGSPRMTTLDIIVFVADTIEPSRDWPGVEALRAAVGVDSAAELFCRAYRESVAHLVETGRVIHPRTIEVWNALVAEVGA